MLLVVLACLPEDVLASGDTALVVIGWKTPGESWEYGRKAEAPFDEELETIKLLLL